jgi:hypothetical protein
MTDHTITTGETDMGLRWAREGDWRVVAYAQGGHTTNRLVEGHGWVIDQNLPPDVERRLLAALGLRPPGEARPA